MTAATRTAQPPLEPVHRPSVADYIKWSLAIALTWLVYSIVPISFYCAFSASHRYFVTGRPVIPTGFWPKFFFFNAFFEVPFTFYLRYLMRKASKLHPPTKLDYETLETLFVSCLEVGLPREEEFSNGNGHSTAHEHGHTSAGLRSAVKEHHAPQKTQSMRGKLPVKTFDDAFRGRVVTDEAALLMRQRMMRWFLNGTFDELRVDNVRQWLAWAFLGCELEDATKDAKIAELMQRGLELMEKRMKHTFPPGRNPQIRAIRLTLDPLRVAHRPFGHYVVTNGVTAAVIRDACKNKGFQRQRAGKCDFLVKPDTRQHQTRHGPQPILFLHGLGIGLGQYAPFIKHLSKHEAAVVILLQPNISGTVTSRHFIDAPSEREHVDAIKEITARNNIASATLISHSNGTMLHGWVLRAIPGLCTRNILVDPVSFRLWEGSVCRNFFYKKVVNHIAVLLTYFVSQELSVANTICRRFQWPSMALWASEFPSLDPKDLHVIFGENDFLVDVPASVDYLKEEAVHDESITVMKGYQHGQALFLDGDGMKLVCHHAQIPR